MALRIPKLLRDLLDTPLPEEGKVLRWGPSGRLENATLAGATPSDRSTAWSSLGVWVGSGPPPTAVSYAAWLTGANGYWAWVDTSTTGTIPLLLDVPAASMQLVGALPTISSQSTISLTSPAASLLLLGTIPTIQVQGTTILYAPAANVSMAGSVPSIFVGGGLIPLTSAAANLMAAGAAPTLTLTTTTVKLTAPGASLLMGATVPTRTLINPVVLSSPSASLLMTAAAPSSSVTGGASVWPMSNSGFETGLAPWVASGGGSGYGADGGGQRYASALMTGSYVGRIYAQSYTDGLEFFSSATGVLSYKFTAANIDTNGGSVTFDIRAIANSGESGYLEIVAYDSTNTRLTKSGPDPLLWRYQLIGAATHGENTSLAIPTLNTTVTRTVNLKTDASAYLVTGKTWADVASVDLVFVAYSADYITGLVEYWVDNFR